MPGTSLELLPSWARAVAILGVPSVIALAMVYWMATGLTSELHILADRFEAHVQQQQEADFRTRGFLFAICLNTSSDDPARARCAVALEGFESLKDLRR